MQLSLLNLIGKILQIRKRILFSTVIILGVSMYGGCGSVEEHGIRLSDTGPGNTMAEEIGYGNRAADGIKTECIAAVYRAVYEEATRTNTAGSPEMMRNMIGELGKKGYAAVDSENQVNMANPESVLQFNEAVEAGKPARLTIIVLTGSGGLTKYDLETEKGNVNVVRGYYRYESGCLENRSTAAYPAEAWQYTEDGYLLFKGNYYTEESYVLVLDEEPEYAAFRVAPLEEKCRELNREYILPVGYQMNDLFLKDWSEEDLAGIDFYDMFDVLYDKANGRGNPYVMDRNPNVGMIYYIPEEEFEGTIMRYFKIDREALRAQTTYLPQEKAYEYRPRGFYELGYSNVPYPEVVDHEEKADGTIELIVNAVFPYESTAKAFSHKVVIRPLPGGGFQYVSNRILTPKENCSAWWYPERLTGEAWKEIYGEKEERVNVFR